MTTTLDDLTDNLPLGIFWADDNPNPDPTGESPPETTQSTNVEGLGKQPTSFTFRIGTVNVQNTPDIPRPQVIRAGQAVSHHFDLFGGQELGEQGQDRADLLRGLGADWGMTTATPTSVQEQIGYRKAMLNLNHVQWHEVIPAGQPYPNPARGWTEAVTLPTGFGFPFRTVDVHMVNKAWNTVPDAHKTLRKRNWEIHYAKLQAFVNTSGRTLPTFVVGDFNRETVQPFGHNFRWLTGSGIDKVGVALPSGYGIQTIAHIRVPDPSDHDAIGVKVKLYRKNKP